MIESLRSAVLDLLKVPAEPHPPAGSPGSLRVFRAGINYFRLRIASWAFGQLIVLAALVFWTAVLMDIQEVVRAEKAERAAGTAPTQVEEQSLDTFVERLSRIFKKHQGENDFAQYRQSLIDIGTALPPWAFVALWIIKVLGIAAYLAQLPFTYAVRRLDYEMRWYMVTDRSLRLRHGVVSLAESTMSFANIQQVTVTQGPLQRFLGLSDVEVRSAGGGGGGGGGHGKQHSMTEDLHVGHFRSVTNADEIRDLIVERLRQFRETGLGDPDEKAARLTVDAHVHGGRDVLSSEDAAGAARELLSEARELRRVLVG